MVDTVWWNKNGYVLNLGMLIILDAGRYTRSLGEWVELYPRVDCNKLFTAVNERLVALPEGTFVVTDLQPVTSGLMVWEVLTKATEPQRIQRLSWLPQDAPESPRAEQVDHRDFAQRIHVLVQSITHLEGAAMVTLRVQLKEAFQAVSWPPTAGLSKETVDSVRLLIASANAQAALCFAAASQGSMTAVLQSGTQVGGASSQTGANSGALQDQQQQQQLQQQQLQQMQQQQQQQLQQLQLQQLQQQQQTAQTAVGGEAGRSGGSSLVSQMLTPMLNIGGNGGSASSGTSVSSGGGGVGGNGSGLQVGEVPGLPAPLLDMLTSWAQSQGLAVVPASAGQQGGGAVQGPLSAYGGGSQAVRTPVTAWMAGAEVQHMTMKALGRGKLVSQDSSTGMWCVAFQDDVGDMFELPCEQGSLRLSTRGRVGRRGKSSLWRGAG
jgi:TolA-binding protein